MSTRPSRVVVENWNLNHEDASCCRHSCDGPRSPRSGEGEAGAIGTPARLSVVGATRLLPRLPSEFVVPRRVIELLICHQPCRLPQGARNKSFGRKIPTDNFFRACTISTVQSLTSPSKSTIWRRQASFMKRCSAFAKPACCGPVDVSPKLLANISDDLARPNLKERDEWPPRIPCR